MTLLGLPLAYVLGLAAAGMAWVLLFGRAGRAAERHVVSSLQLWTWANRRRAATRRAGGLVGLGLLLSCAIVVLLSAAAGDPRPGSGARAQPTTVVLLDASRSMGTLNGPKRGPEARLSQAKSEVRKFLAKLPNGAPVQLVALAPTPQPLAPVSSDRKALLAALDTAEVVPVGVDFDATTRFLQDLLPEFNEPQLLWVSDGVSLPEDAAARLHVLNAPSYQRLIGSEATNVAVVNLGARRSNADRDRADVLMTLANDGDAEVQVSVALRDGPRPVLETRHTIAPHSQLPVRLTAVLCLSGELTAQLSAPRLNNALPLDDLAYAALPPRGRLRVLLVSEGNIFVEAGLLADGRVELTRRTPEAFKRAGQATAGYEVILFDDFVPEAAPEGPALYIHPAGGQPSAPLTVTGRLTRPFFDRQKRGDPLLHGLSLSDANIADALRVAPAVGDVVAAESRAGPLLVHGTRHGKRFVALTMRLTATDLPLRTAFPILLRNTLDWLTLGAHGDQESASVDATLEVRGSSSLTVRGPEGPVATQATTSTTWSFQPQVAGFYYIQDVPTPIAVNPRRPSDASLSPRRHWAERVVSDASRGSSPAPWQLLGALALLLVALEFWLQARRGRHR